MSSDEKNTVNRVSIISIFSIILIFVILSVGSSNFLSNREKKVIPATRVLAENYVINSSSSSKKSIMGNYKGIATILDPKLQFTSVILILSPNGRFTLQADSFNLSVFKSDQLAVNGDYPFLYFDIEGDFVESEDETTFTVDKANYRFDIEEISLEEDAKIKLESVLKNLGISFDKFKELPIKNSLKISQNDGFITLLSDSSSDFILNIKVRKF